MTDLRTVAQQALEFVTSKKWGTTPYMDVRVYEDAARLRDTLRAALAQQEQAEPVAWLYYPKINPNDHHASSVRWAKTGFGLVETPLYAAPPRREWKGLTEEEKADILFPLTAAGASDMDCARAIEQALRSKNQ